VAKNNLSDSLKRLLILRRKQCKHLSVSANTSGSPTPVNVYLSVERTLVMENILHVRDIKTTGSYICAN